MANGRLTIRGESKFLNGTNLPWLRYARDFGNNAYLPHEGVSTRELEVRIQFEAMAAMGAHHTRWFVFGDGTGGIEWNNGLPSGVDGNFFKDMDAALRIAQENHVTISFVLLDHRWMFDRITQTVNNQEVPVRDRNGNLVTGHPEILNSKAGRDALLQNVLLPIFQRYGKNGVRADLGAQIAAYEVMNEPDWVVSGFDVNRGVGHPISPADFTSFVRSVADAVHNTTSSAVTIGGGRAKYLAEWDKDAYGLDHLEVHQYAKDTFDWDLFGQGRKYVDLKLRRPLVLAEFPAKNDVHGRTLRAWKDFAYDNGYAGAMSWCFLGTPYTDGQYGPVDKAEEKRWAADHSADIFLFGGPEPTLPGPGDWLRGIRGDFPAVPRIKRLQDLQGDRLGLMRTPSPSAQQQISRQTLDQQRRGRESQARLSEMGRQQRETAARLADQQRRGRESQARLSEMGRQQRETAARLADQQLQRQRDLQRLERERLARSRPPTIGTSRPGFPPISSPYPMPGSINQRMVLGPIRPVSPRPPVWERSRPPLSRAGSGWDPGRFGFPGATAGPSAFPRPIYTAPDGRRLGIDRGSRD